MDFTCRICGNQQNNRSHRAREMLFGTRDEFEYVECGACGTLQIASVPDLSKYYPDNYYSLDRSTVPEIEKSLKRRAAARFVGRYLLNGRGIVGRLVDQRRPSLRGYFPPSLLDPVLKLTVDSSILDIGCGSGQLLRTLHAFGFRDLSGADLFIERDLKVHRRIRISRSSIADIKGEFDLIMLHHSFEHLPEPGDALLQIKKLLKANGVLLIRMPVVAEAWERYGVDWVQLDAPRHLHLFTEEGFRSLAGRLGLDVMKVVYDSHAFQFFGSEQYKMDIPMNDPRTFTGVGPDSIFSQEQIDGWSMLSEELNARSRGDQAAFYLRQSG
jgi:SAM-dependent methyltransferase